MRKKLLLFFTVLILCSLSALLIANAQSDPTVVITASQASLNRSTKDQQIQISVLLSNDNPLAKDISGVNFALASDSDYLVLDSQAAYLTDAFAYETETGEAPQAGTTEEYLYNELQSSAVTYIDSQFVGLKVRGIVPAPVNDTEFILMTINATLLANAPAGTYTITASDFTASDTSSEAIITDDFSCAINVVDPDSVGESNVEYSLTLQGNTTGGTGGDIGINVKMNLSDELLADNGAYLRVEYNGKVSKVPLTDLKYESNINKYTISTYFPAAKMTETVSYTVFNGAGSYGLTYPLSIQSYCQQIIDYYAEYYPKLVPMVKALLNYGAAAQKYFQVDADNLANSSLDNADGWGAIESVTTFDDIDAAVYNGKIENIGVKEHNISLVLNAETVIKHYITLEDGQKLNDYEFTVENSVVTPTEDGERYYITISSIPATELDRQYTLSITRKSDSAVYSIKYSAMNYVQSMYEICKNNDSYADLRTLLKSIYLYNKAAETYFGK